jgi:phage-related protein
MPLCRSIQGRKGLWEIRTQLSGGRIVRVFFCIHGEAMVLLHGFMKESQKTPEKDIETAMRRMRGL